MPIMGFMPFIMFIIGTIGFIMFMPFIIGIIGFIMFMPFIIGIWFIGICMGQRSWVAPWQDSV